MTCSQWGDDSHKRPAAEISVIARNLMTCSHENSDSQAACAARTRLIAKKKMPAARNLLLAMNLMTCSQPLFDSQKANAVPECDSEDPAGYPAGSSACTLMIRYTSGRPPGAPKVGN
jgi:hypothetical protein